MGSSSRVTTVKLPGGKTPSLTFEVIDKELLSVILEGVGDFRCNGLSAWSIIIDLQKIDEAALDDLARVTCRESRLDDRARHPRPSVSWR